MKWSTQAKILHLPVVRVFEVRDLPAKACSSISLYVLFVWCFYEYVYQMSCALKPGLVTVAEQRSQVTIINVNLV